LNISVNRRDFLQKGALCASMLPLRSLGLHAAAGRETFASGDFLGLVEFLGEGFAPVGVRLGSELDQRLYTDLSRLSEDRLLTPEAEFYLRTGVSQLLPDSGEWKIQVDGFVEQPYKMEISALRRSAKPVGRHLMECAGNVREAHFGLISVASWNGVFLAEILDQAKIQRRASQVLVFGFDQYAHRSLTSIPGASWIFPIEELKAARAFLVTGMYGKPLTPAHGAPVRLIVPGWYGCACIKWVNRITLVDKEVEATSQMQEYAERTLQNGIPELAKDYQPAKADHAAMPIRVEKWRIAGKLKYRITGILWGGSQPVRRLGIRFRPDESFRPVEGFRQIRTDPWTTWTYAWSPREPGYYTIRLAITDPLVRARKLDSGHYDRFVEIHEV
jgi:DMSO/TMAO reductase YedYZ molybdopterin-dependent catalytic subunit